MDARRLWERVYPWLSLLGALAILTSMVMCALWVVKSPEERYWDCMENVYVVEPDPGEEVRDFESDDVVCSSNEDYPYGDFGEWERRRQNWDAIPRES